MYSNVIVGHGPLNQYHLKRSAETINRALAEHPRTSAIRVDLRFPAQEQYLCQDMPRVFADTDPAVITRFIASLDAKISAAQNRKRKEGKRVHPCTLRYIWVKEYSQNHQIHYHVLLLLNKDAYHLIGDYEYSPRNTDLGSMIREAWCSALRVDCNVYWPLIHFPNNPIYYLNSNDHPDDFRKSWDALFYRISYFAKESTKQCGTGYRAFGCSQK